MQNVTKPSNCLVCILLFLPNINNCFLDLFLVNKVVKPPHETSILLYLSAQIFQVIFMTFP